MILIIPLMIPLIYIKKSAYLFIKTHEIFFILTIIYNKIREKYSVICEKVKINITITQSNLLDI